MMSQIPISWENSQNPDIDKAILLSVIAAETDAQQQYLQMRASTKNPALLSLLSSLQREEAVHLGEAIAVYKTLDKDWEQDLKDGEDEASDGF